MTSNQTELNEYVKEWRKWRKEPLKWVYDHFDSEVFYHGKLTAQQEEFFVELGKLIAAKELAQWRDKYPKLGIKLTKSQEEYAAKLGISVQSGMGTGKDAVVALAILYFLSCFEDPLIPCTANTAKQLRNVLWAEIAKWMGKSKRLPNGRPILEELFEWQSEKIYLKQKKGRKWFAEAITINTRAGDEEQAEAVAGRHEDNMMWVIDEASGISDSVFNKVEGTCTSAINIVIIIYNPTRNRGFAIDSQKDPQFIARRWNAEDSEITSKERHRAMEEKYGRDSNPFRIRVLGLPPRTDEDTLIPWDWIMDSTNRFLETEGEPEIKGVDVGAGGNKSVILTRQGGTVTKITRISTKDTMEVAGKVAGEIQDSDPDAVAVDIIGIGKGVYDRLRETHTRIHPCDMRRTAYNEERFPKRRDELWWKLRDHFEKGTISIPNDQELIDQIGSIKYGVDNSGRVKIEGKRDMRRRGMESPDEADALVISYWVDDNLYKKTVRDRGDEKEEREPKPQKYGWMSA